MVRAGLGSDGENCMTERLSVIHRTNIRGLIIMKLNSFHGIKKKKKDTLPYKGFDTLIS